MNGRGMGWRGRRGVGSRRTKRKDDGCSVAPALPSVLRKLQVPSQGRGKDGGCRGTSQGYQDERWRRDRKERKKSALVVKRKQQRETEEGGVGDGQRNADSAEWDADGSKTPSLRFFLFPPHVWFY